MRWLSDDICDFKVGDRRILTRFLVFPKKLNGIWRFLEKASWLQEIRWDSGQYRFVDICWMDIESDK